MLNNIKNLIEKITPSFNNWVLPSDIQIRQEYEWEYLNHWIDTHYFENYKDFYDAIKKGNVVLLDKDTLFSIENATPRINNIKALKKLVSGYIFPRDVDSLIEGFKNNNPIPMPIVVDEPNYGLRILSGNTRLTLANILNIPIKVIIIKP